MYIGRFIVVGKTEHGHPFVVYRVSSRSYPNRTARVINNHTVSIIPTNPKEYDGKQYLTYNCIRVVADKVIVGNGSHTDRIADRFSGDPQYTLTDVLSEMGYEMDGYHTPRIAAIVDRRSGYLGYVNDSGVKVKRVKMRRGIGQYLGVYNACRIDENQVISIPVIDVGGLANYVLNYSNFEYPVVSVAVIFDHKLRFAIAHVPH